MKKSLLVAVLVLFSLTACTGIFGGGEEAPAVEAPAAEAVDINATVDAEASTQAAQTMDALDAAAAEEMAKATPTLVPATPTQEMPATATETLAPTEETTATPDEKAEAATEEDVTPTVEGAEPSATEEVSATATLAATATESVMTATPGATATSVYPSPTSPIAINMPPENLVGYRPVEIRNMLKGRVYISFQGVTEYDYRPVIEYDLAGFKKVRIHVPQGEYKIVVYVGKNPMIDYVTINKNTNLVITIRKNSLRIEK